jgi:hypothetical protein
MPADKAKVVADDGGRDRTAVAANGVDAVVSLREKAAGDIGDHLADAGQVISIQQALHDGLCAVVEGIIAMHHELAIAHLELVEFGGEGPGHVEHRDHIGVDRGRWPKFH